MARLKKLGFIACCVLLLLPFCANGQVDNYIVNHRIVANVLSVRYGIPASIILAVAVVESAAGQSDNARVLKNHFGIVGKNEFVNRFGHKSRYKQYYHEIESYIDFCNIVSRKKYYRKLSYTSNISNWIHAMSHAGYSEEPETWEKKIFGIISTYKL